MKTFRTFLESKKLFKKVQTDLHKDPVMLIGAAYAAGERGENESSYQRAAKMLNKAAKMLGSESSVDEEGGVTVFHSKPHALARKLGFKYESSDSDGHTHFFRHSNSKVRAQVSLGKLYIHYAF